MTALLVGLVVTLAVAVLVLLYELHGMPRLRRRCIVSLLGTTDSIEGVLWTRRGRWLVIKDPHLVRTSEQGSKVDKADGEILIDRDQVSFVQVL
jgi:hypothetical protein